MAEYLNQALFEYPDAKVLSSGQGRALEAALERWEGVLPLVHRFAGRSFCTPGERLRIAKEHLRPAALGVGLDELWICCTTPIVTGTINAETGEKPFREGEAHVLTADGQLVSLQELIEANPKLTIGPRHESFSRKMFGKPTWGIVSKKFDNKHPIPHHLHWEKWEVYDINRFDNGAVHPSHYYTTAMGLYSWVTKDDFLACMKRFGSPGGNGVRRLSPHVMVPVDQGGFCMPNGVLHSPTNLVHHELHVLMDEHFLAEDLTQDGEIPASVAFLACREQDYPRDKHGDWDYLVSKFDFAANQDPNFVRDNSRPPLRAEQFSGEGVESTWIVYGELLGEQKCSILRVHVAPGKKIGLALESPAVFHTNQGRGRVGGLELALAKELRLGQFASECGYITQAALGSSGGVLVENTGSEDFVVTLDFPQEAHRVTPGL